MASLTDFPNDSNVPLERSASLTKSDCPIERADKVVFGFPIYGITFCLENGIIIVAGGGGPAKSGVRNAIKTLKYEGGPNVRCLTELSCASQAPTCLSILPTDADGEMGEGRRRLVCGVNDRCWLIELKGEENRLCLLKSVQSDFSQHDGYQKRIAVGKEKGGVEVIATAGTDGFVRVWNSSDLRLMSTVNVSECLGKCEDICLDEEFNLLVVTPSNIGLFTTDCEDGAVDFHLQWKISMDGDCGKIFRFAKITKDAKYVVCAENGTGPRIKSGVTIYEKWSKSVKSRILLPERGKISAFYLSNSLVACGTTDGSIFVYEIDNMTLLYSRKRCHKFIITCLHVEVVENHVLILVGSGDGTISIHRFRMGRPWILFIAMFMLIFIILLILFVLAIAEPIDPALIGKDL